jgi:hypothetical protein
LLLVFGSQVGWYVSFFLFLFFTIYARRFLLLDEGKRFPLLLKLTEVALLRWGVPLLTFCLGGQRRLVLAV